MTMIIGPNWGISDGTGRAFLAYFKKSEHNSRGESETHSDKGPQWCSDIEEKNELMEAIIRGAQNSVSLEMMISIVVRRRGLGITAIHPSRLARERIGGIFEACA